MKILYIVDEAGFEEYIGPFKDEASAEDWAARELSAIDDYEVLDLTQPKGVITPGTIEIEIEALNKLDLTPLLEG